MHHVGIMLISLVLQLANTFNHTEGSCMKWIGCYRYVYLNEWSGSGFRCRYRYMEVSVYGGKRFNGFTKLIC